MASSGGDDAASPSRPVLFSPLCASLQSTAATANESLRDFLVYYPAARQELTALSRELADVQMVARLLSRNGGGADEGDGSASSVPPMLLATIRSLVGNALDLTAEIVEALQRPDKSNSARSGDGRQAWLEQVVERISGTIRATETVRAAMNLGLDALLFATNFQPNANDNELPPYDSTQIVQEIMNLRARLRSDSDSDEPRVHVQRPLVSEFADTLQQYIERTSSTLVVPGNTNGGSRSDVSSTHSVSLAPAYNAIDITTPAPAQINIRHIVKKDISQNEILQVAFFTRQGKTTIAIANLESPMRCYSTTAEFVANIDFMRGVDMNFSPNGRTWACRGEEETRDLNPATHDGISFRRPVVYIGDYIDNRRGQQMRDQPGRPLCFSPDGKYLAVAGARGRIALLDTRPMVSLATAVILNCHHDMVTHAVFTPNNHALVSLSLDGSIRLTDPTTRESLAKLDTDTWKKPQFLGVTPDSEVIVSIWGDTVYHWSYNTGTLESYTLGAKRRREGWPIAISPDCRFLACRNDDGVDLSDLHTGRVLYSIRFQSGFVTAAAFSDDARYLALGKAASWMGIKVMKSTLDVWELIF